MAERSAAHQALRQGTAADHERLDSLFGRFDLGDKAAYRAFLTAHAIALPGVERALDAAGFGDALEDWGTRHREQAIATDLAALGAPMPSPLLAPALDTRAAQWGAAYVIEGSRLGGAMLARSVPDGLPTAYLATPLPAGAWRRFLAALDGALATPEEIALATKSARNTFGLFEQAGKQALGVHA